MNAKSNNRIHKFLYGIVLAGMILSLCFGMSGSPAARAQEAGTETPTEEVVSFATPIIQFNNLERVSPNGQYIAYLTSENLGMGGSAIWVANADGSENRIIISGGDNYWVTNPVWSPDRNNLAYLRVINSKSSQYEVISRYEIWVTNLSGSNDQLLTDTPYLNPSLGYGGETNITWEIDNEIEFDDNSVFPPERYALKLDSLSFRDLGQSPSSDITAQSQPGNVPYFSQCGSWGNNTLGTCNGSTICNAGCAISAAAMVFKYFGVDTDPGRLNTWLKSNSGYDPDRNYGNCLIKWATAANISSNITWIGSFGQDFNRLKSELDSGYPVILQVNNSGTTHFVVAAGYSGSTYYINDPLYSSRTTLTSYGNTFGEMRIYHGPIGGGTAPNAPSLSNPGNGSSNPYNYDLNFQWNSSSGATEYLVEWWGGPYGTMQPCGWSSSTSCHIGTVAAGNTYSWHVKARNSVGESGWSSTWTFTIQSQQPPPPAPSLSNPGNGSSNPYNYDLTFQWNSSSGATEYLVEWWGGSYGTMQPCGWSSSTSCHIGTVAAGNTYSWHVKARNSVGESGWSSTWTFTIQSQPTAPSAPSLSNPGNGSSNPYNYDLTFQWNSSSWATEYLVEWWGGSYGTMQPCGWSSSTSCHIGSVIAGNTYSWHVKARNSYGTSDWSSTWTFTIQPQPLPDLVPYPRSGAAEPIVISRTTGNRNQDTLISGQTAYIDWGYKNIGQADAGPHHVKIWIDGQLYIDYAFNSLGAGYLGGFDDWGDSDYIAPGAHSVTMTVDANSDVNESNESNNTWSGTFYWRAQTVNLDRVFTTDDTGAAGLDTTNTIKIGDVQVNAYKDTFNPGDPLRLYLELTNEFPDDRTFTGEWQVINPAGRVVPELSNTSTITLGSGGWWWWLNRTIPTYSLRGQYTFIGKITYNGVTTTQTTTFTVAGPPTVEVYDAFVADANGNVASLGVEPQRSLVLDINSQTVPTFNAGDGIQLYIDTFNDVVDGEAATFKWEVIDLWGRSLAALQWDGDLNSSLGYTWWYLPRTIPSNAITGDYTFTGYITHGDRTTHQTATFHVTGPAGPANDNISAPTVISSVLYNTQLDTWGATIASDDPVPSCGSGQNSNSVWYRNTPPANGLLHVDTQYSNYDTVVAIWTGSQGSLAEIACNDDSFSTTQSWLETPVTSGTVYYIEVMDYGLPGGGYLNLKVDFAPSITNDDFNSPTVISSMPYTVTQDTRAATKASDDPDLTQCNRLAGLGSVWYRYTPSAAGKLQLDTSGSDYDTLLAAWAGARGSLTPVGCNDDIGLVNGVWNLNSTLTIMVDSGVTYYIEISVFNGFIDTNVASVMSIQKNWNSDLTAQFSGGQMVLNAHFVPPTFNDVPYNYSETMEGVSYPLYAYIQALWDAGYTAGCLTDPLRYCPDNTMTRAESAVFMLRGNFGSGYVSPVAPWDTFADDWSPGTWAEKWAEGMWQEGMTAGCLIDPLRFCPWDQFPREQAAVFGLRMKYGMSYTPPAASGTLFADMTDIDYWGTKWAEQAYIDGLLPACGTDTGSGKPLYCPNDLVTRAWGAYLIVIAKDLPLTP